MEKHYMAYSESDLIAFGNYLLSKARRNSYKQNPFYPSYEMLQERLSQVNDADIQNWKQERKNKHKN